MNSQQRLIYKLISRSINLCKTYNNQNTLQALCQKLQMAQLLANLDVHQLQLDKKAPNITKGVGICNILDQYPLRITVYYLPQGQTMKLHDHPQMEVVNYLLQGKMEAKLYTHLEKDIYLKKVVTLTKGSCSFIDGQRGKIENLHEFYAIEPTFFLDIIFPDYDYTTRPCNFFEEEEILDEEKVRLKEVFNEEVNFSSL